jgi:peptidoglycan hydrolase-like protein with peptidoglycan-binding domain
MKRAKPGTLLSVALVAAALAGSAAALAQTAAPPAAQAPLPPPAEAALPPAGAASPPAGEAPGPIAALQQQLKREGFAPGPVNGVMTEETRRALILYQRRNGRPPEALAAAAPGGAGADPVRRAQADLQRLGLFAGPVDGIVGPRMRDAIIRFEAARHLAVDPRVSDNLLAALGEAGADPGTAPASAAATAAQTATPETAPPETTPEATGRRKLPPGVNPPPIR